MSTAGVVAVAVRLPLVLVEVLVVMVVQAHQAVFLDRL
jgi:hypothetical protein